MKKSLIALHVMAAAGIASGAEVYRCGNLYTDNPPKARKCVRVDATPNGPVRPAPAEKPEVVRSPTALALRN